MSVGKMILAGGMAVLLGIGAHLAFRTKVARVDAPPERPLLPGEIRRTPRIREGYPIRVGGLLLRDLGERRDAQEDSATLGVKLSEANRNWIATHLDLAAMDARCLEPMTFPLIHQQDRLFTPLLYVYASSLYEQNDHKGNVGGWTPAMSRYTLRHKDGTEVKHPDAGGHWMDFGSAAWAALWARQVNALAAKYRAAGALAADMPLGNTFVGEDLAKYPKLVDRVNATSSFLAAVYSTSTPKKYLVVPSAVGFDELIGHPTVPVKKELAEHELSGRGWDEFYGLMDGAWAEGWVHPYWSEQTLPEKFWEIQLEAADREATRGGIFVACLAYRDADELEYGLASYLLVSHRQGRFVVQPMPLRVGERPNASNSLTTLREEWDRYESYFDAPLGDATETRYRLEVDGGTVWRRPFFNGAVYVNSQDRGTVIVRLGGVMKSLSGQSVTSVTLGPHTGAILLYPPKANAKSR